jgi:hypothetical protein
MKPLHPEPPTLRMRNLTKHMICDPASRGRVSEKGNGRQEINQRAK